MARFGQLFLQMGKWNGRQIISEDWVRASAMTSYSDNVRREGWGYAYMWWMNLYGQEHLNYSAQGVATGSNFRLKNQHPDRYLKA